MNSTDAVKVGRLVDLTGLFADARKRFFTRVMVIITNDAKVWAPVQQKATGKSGKGNKRSGGYLRNSLGMGNGINQATADFAVVGTNASYGKYLDDNKKTGKYHYRSGPHMGSVTTGWLSDSPDRTRAEIEDALNRTRAEIEKGWKSG